MKKLLSSIRVAFLAIVVLMMVFAFWVVRHFKTAKADVPAGVDPSLGYIGGGDSVSGPSGPDDS